MKMVQIFIFLPKEYLKRNFDFDFSVDSEQMLSRKVESITPLAIVGQLWQQSSAAWMFAKNETCHK